MRGGSGAQLGARRGRETGRFEAGGLPGVGRSAEQLRDQLAVSNTGAEAKLLGVQTFGIVG